MPYSYIIQSWRRHVVPIGHMGKARHIGHAAVTSMLTVSGRSLLSRSKNQSPANRMSGVSAGISTSVKEAWLLPPQPNCSMEALPRAVLGGAAAAAWRVPLARRSSANSTQTVCELSSSTAKLVVCCCCWHAFHVCFKTCNLGCDSLYCTHGV